MALASKVADGAARRSYVGCMSDLREDEQLVGELVLPAPVDEVVATTRAVVADHPEAYMRSTDDGTRLLFLISEP